MAYSAGYPVIHNLTVPGDSYADYSIDYKGETIYKGRIYARGEAAETVEIDIAPICRDWLDTNYSALLGSAPTPISAEVPTDEMNRNTIGIFSVDGTLYPIKYDYSAEYILDVGTSGNLNDPITEEVDRRQYIPISAFNLSGPTDVAWVIGEEASTQTASSQNINLMAQNIRAVEPGTEITATNFGVTHKFKVVDECRNRFVIYYVNKMGGLDALLCSGRRSENWNPDRIDMRLYTDRRDRLKFENTRIYQEIGHLYNLTTPYLSDEQAEKIDHLINSPKVFIHDFENDAITACLVNTSGLETKLRRQDGLVYYNFQVIRSQPEIRR